MNKVKMKNLGTIPDHIVKIGLKRLRPIIADYKKHSGNITIEEFALVCWDTGFQDGANTILEWKNKENHSNN